jgi:hypothetical protein
MIILFNTIKYEKKNIKRMYNYIIMSDTEDYVVIESQKQKEEPTPKKEEPVQKKKRKHLEVKPDYFKTEDERRTEIKVLLNQLADLGIIASIPGMKDFLKHSQLFIKEGVYWEGRIRLTGTNRVLCGFLTNRKNKVSDITLKYEKE